MKKSLVCLFLFASQVCAETPEKIAYVKGYADVSYNYLVRSNHFTSGVLNRFNDVADNGFTLQQAAATFAYIKPQGLGGLFNFIAGRDAIYLAPIGFDPNVFGSQVIGLTIPQAYVQYRYQKTTLIVGQTLSYVGLEQLDYTLNTIFSNSLLYYMEPGGHIGVVLEHDLTDQFNVFVSLINGWDTVKIAGQMNSFEFGVTYKPNENVDVTLAGGLGHSFLDNTIISGPTSQLNIINFYGTWHATPKLGFSVDALYAKQKKAILPTGFKGQAAWGGIAGYVDYYLTEKWIASARAEYFADNNGYRTDVRQQLREGTLSLAYKPTPYWQIRGTVRHDFSNKSSFVNKNGRTTNPNQQSYAVDAMYQF
jgi:hypothetical protein